MKAIALDDEPLALDIISAFCKRSQAIELLATFTKVDEAKLFMQQHQFDLIFLDVQMPKLSGIEFATLLPQDSMIIFSTAHSNYAVKGFDLNAIDYLLKPYSYERFAEALDKAQAYYNYLHSREKKSNRIFFKTNYSLVPVEVETILLIESFGDNLHIHYGSREKVITRMTMKAIMEILPDSNFVRVHRSYIVPLNRITQVKNKTIFIDEHQIPLGVRYEDAFMEVYKKMS